ncbi:hypothetical protein [Streptomyces sp. Isolate_219]|uniref:hypothetical protein n=1 Tax=Streptomyces sp. Isolate_219 TaxID=2950110 RepID=UPI0021CA0352|nr:hypothetical protein [Streptomyces sp. Isolate_219]MCR8576182.1 hypothetical protein [Streptomyces sp. Isolate_219]
MLGVDDRPAMGGQFADDQLGEVFGGLGGVLGILDGGSDDSDGGGRDHAAGSWGV